MKWQLTISFLYFFITIHAQSGGKPSYTDSLQNKLATTKTDTGKIRILYALGKYWDYKDSVKAKGYLDRSLAMAERIKSDTDIANIYSYLGEDLFLKGDFANGKTLINKVYNLANKDGNKKMMVMPLTDLGDAAEIEGDYPLAQDYFFKCLAIAEEINMQDYIPMCYVNISVVFLNQNDFDKTMLYAKKALDFVKSKPNLAVEVKAWEMMGSAAVQKGKFTDARNYYQQCLRLYQEKNDKPGIATMYSLLALSYTGDFDNELQFALKAKAMWDSIEPENIYAINNLGNIGVAYAGIARLKQANQQSAESINFFSKAEQFLTKTVQLAYKTNSKQNEIDFTDSLAVIQAAMGEYKDAYNNLQTHNEIYDSIFSQENKNKIASLEGKHEIALRDKQLEINKLEFANQQKQRWILIGGVVLLLFIAGLVYNQSRQRKKANFSLSQLNNQLEEANTIKVKFFNIINHDLRSPVAGFINLLHLQQNEGDLLDETKQREYVAKAAVSAENLLETMEDLLLWSKGQMENFKPHIKPVSVESLFNYLQKSTPAKTNIVINFHQQQAMTLHTDEHYIKTIMHNLTNNAVKALGTQPMGTIEWRSWQAGAAKFLSIKDNGPGATEEQLRPLYDETATMGIKNGLGLHIVRDMAKAIGCNILVNTKLEQGIEIRLVFSIGGIQSLKEIKRKA